jgi:hypothetical protein
MRSIVIIIININIEYIDSYSKVKQTDQKKEKGTEGRTELSLEIEINSFKVHKDMKPNI